MDEILISQEPGCDETDSRTFINYGRYFVPDRQRLIDIFCQLLPRKKTQLKVLELCSGAGILAKALLDRFPNLTIKGLDGSDEMINFTKEKLSQYGSRFNIKKFDLENISWGELNEPFEAVISALCIHHLDEEQKQKLFLNIYNNLEKEGVFIIADLIQPMSPTGVKLAANLWDSAVLERALQTETSADAYKTFLELRWNLYHFPDKENVDKPSSLFQQLKWLELAGFEAFDVYWMNAGHVVFGGMKY